MANPLSQRRPGGLANRRAAGDAVVVTGAGGGIGQAVAERLLQDGWAVVATDRTDTSLEALTPQSHPALRCLAMDVSDRARIDEVVKHLRSQDVRVAGLVNVAGVLQDVTPFMDMRDDDQRRVWDVNYFGAQQCIQAFAPFMLDAGAGSIVNVTSINELRPLPLHAYAPTKVALGALTQLTAGEFGPHGVRVNAVAPGFTLTPIFRDKLASGKRSATAIEAHSALGRLVEVEEIASVVSFLMSDDSSAVTGASIPVDAGWLATSHWMNFRELGRA